MTFKIVGVRTQEFGPLEEQIVWLEPGVNAVYGLNGSGKSYFLEQIAQLAAGTTAMGAGLILKWEYSPDTHNPGIGIDDDIKHGELKYVSGAGWTGGSNPEDHMPDFPQEMAPEDIDSADVEKSERNRRILREVLDHGFLLATPLGTDPASWALWPLGVPSTDTPTLVDEISKFTNLADQFRGQLEAMRLADPKAANVEAWDEDAWDDLHDKCFKILEESELRTSVLTHSLNILAPNGLYLAWAFRSPDWTYGSAAWTFGVGKSGQPVFLRAFIELRQPTWSLVVEGISDRATDSSPAQSIDNDTRNALVSLVDRLDAEDNFDPSRGVPEPDDMLRWTSEMSKVASEILPLLLQDAFPLDLDVGDIRGWLSGTHPKWTAAFEYRPVAAAPVLQRFAPLAELSKAQRRLAEFAIRVAIGIVSDAGSHRESLTPLWIIDEPEAALHRSAEEHVAKGLVTLAEKYQVTIVAATHSPELLDHPRIHLLNARTPMGHTRIDPLDTINLSALLELGLRPSDLLRGVRTFILVEGEQDKIILEEFFGTELTNMRAQLLPARGASRYKEAFDSQFLFEYTDACILATMDNLNEDHLTRTWDRARELAQRGDLEKANKELLGELPGTQGAENKFMREFCTRALKAGQHERVHLFGFSLPDITDYLPIEKFAPKFVSWGSAREAKDASNTNIPNFKKWLEQTERSDFSPENVRRVARELLDDGTTPDDFLRFISAAKTASDTRNG